jgi:hypothetical protein
MHGEKAMSRLSIRPIRPGELEDLTRRAAQDNHRVVHATHVAFKDGQIVGYVSLIHGATLVNLWLSTGAGAMDSLAGLTAVEALCSEHGSQFIVMPCSVDSPFHPKMEKLGFNQLGTASINVKGI